MRRRSRGDSWVLAGAAFFSACAGPATESPREPSAIRSAPRRQRLALVEDARTWPRAAAPFVSRGHGSGNFTIDIRISPNSIDAVRNLVLGQFVPIGTVAVAFHSEVLSGGPQPVFAMQKQVGGRWEFFVADPDGTLAADSAPPSCARCHSDAPTDFLFVPVELAGRPLSNALPDAGR